MFELIKKEQAAAVEWTVDLGLKATETISDRQPDQEAWSRVFAEHLRFPSLQSSAVSRTAPPREHVDSI